MSHFFSLPDGREAELYRLEANDFAVEISNFGGIVHRILTPDRDGKATDVVLGYGNPADYLVNAPHFGAMIGRVTNRIAGARFTLDGVDYNLIPNDRGNSLHGGAGFSHRLWDVVRHTDTELELRLLSPDGDAGYPGEVKISTVYRIDTDRRLTLETRAVTDRPTVIAITNHLYFNLNGEDAGSLDDQELKVFADCRQEGDSMLLPTGKLLELAGTPFDLASFRSFQAVFEAIGRSLDDSFVNRKHQSGVFAPNAAVRSLRTGITLEADSTEPAVQVYTAGGLGDGGEIAKNGRPHAKKSGFCLECQTLNGAVHYPDFPSIRLEPGQEYRQKTVYAFGLLP